MNFKNNLMENEEVIFEFIPHWIVFLRTFLWFGATLFILLMGPFYTVTRFQLFGGPSIYQCLASLMFVVAFYHTIKSFVSFLCSRFVITNKRILLLRGFFRQSSVEVNLSKIERIEIMQSLLGKALNYGDLRFGASIDKAEFFNLSYPQWVRGMLQETIEKYAKSDSRPKKNTRTNLETLQMSASGSEEANYAN